jgi:hypothetical protein
MLAASRMELNMVLDNRRGGLFSLGLRLEFAGGGRLVLTASPQKSSGAWESIIMDRAFSVMVWVMLSPTPF